MSEESIEKELYDEHKKFVMEQMERLRDFVQSKKEIPLSSVINFNLMTAASFSVSVLATLTKNLVDEKDEHEIIKEFAVAFLHRFVILLQNTFPDLHGENCSCFKDLEKKVKGKTCH